MERNITITLEKARELYNSDNESLKEIALQAFSKEELGTFDFSKIKTFKDAVECLYGKETIKYYKVLKAMADVYPLSKASAAMFKLNIIRKALNLGQDLHLTKNPKDSCIYYPYNPFVTESSTYYKGDLNSGRIKIIGKIKNEGTLYNVLGGYITYGNFAGFGNFNSYDGASDANAAVGFLGCVTEKIAQHFSKYFGMLITEAKYADMVDFEIIENKYQ